MDAARALIGTLAPASIPASTFLEHTTNQPFDKSPIRGRNGFEVVARKPEITEVFGVAFFKEARFTMVVRVGHAPFSDDGARENFTADDINHIADRLEDPSVWGPTGIQQCFFDGAGDTDKRDPNWWITELFFRIIYLSGIVTT